MPQLALKTATDPWNLGAVPRAEAVIGADWCRSARAFRCVQAERDVCTPSLPVLNYYAALMCRTVELRIPLTAANLSPIDAVIGLCCRVISQNATQISHIKPYPRSTLAPFPFGFSSGWHVGSLAPATLLVTESRPIRPHQAHGYTAWLEDWLAYLAWFPGAGGGGYPVVRHSGKRVVNVR